MLGKNLLLFKVYIYMQDHYQHSNKDRNQYFKQDYYQYLNE